MCCSFIFFFFQAEDGIRDSSVTGVQTCALPISIQNLDNLSKRAAEALLDFCEAERLTFIAWFPHGDGSACATWRSARRAVKAIRRDYSSARCVDDGHQPGRRVVRTPTPRYHRRSGVECR